MQSAPSLIKLPQQTEVILYLIKEDLKGCRFFDTLRTVGFEESFYQPELGVLILTLTGLNDQSDETFDLYTNMLQQHSQNIEPEETSVTKHALAMYEALMIEKRRRINN